MNRAKLRGVMAERGVTYEFLAKGLRVNRSTLCRKIRKGDDGVTVADVLRIRQLLNLSPEETRLIFFSPISQ